MDQVAQQQHPGFQPGQSGNPAGRESRAARAVRIEAKARELAQEFGGYDALSPVDRVLVTQAATLLLRRPKSAEDVVRVANSIQRLLASVALRYGRRSATPDVKSYLISKAAELA
jgi:hypothetical protein